MKLPSIHATCYAAVLIVSLAVSRNGLCDKSYGPGVTDTDIKLGQTMPYSGPASAYANYGRVETGYFRMLNERGGINGRKVTLISLDDGYSPPKTVEQTRKLIEDEQVLAIFGSLGTPTMSAVYRYLNQRKVPNLFLATAANKFNDPKNFPWTMGIAGNYQHEAATYAQYLLKTKPDAKVGVLYQNDDAGKDFVKGFRDGLGSLADKMVVAELSYEITDPTVDSQVVSLKTAGADTFFNTGTPKFAAQAIRKAYDSGWRPVQLLTIPASSIATVLITAGVEKSVGVLSGSAWKDPTDPRWASAADVKEFLEFMRKYYPEGNPADHHNAVAYVGAYLMAQVLRQCEDDLTRDNVMRQAANLRGVEAPMLLPGVRVNTSPTDYQPIKQLQMRRFDGKQWVPFGDLLTY